MIYYLRVEPGCLKSRKTLSSLLHNASSDEVDAVSRHVMYGLVLLSFSYIRDLMRCQVV